MAEESVWDEFVKGLEGHIFKDFLNSYALFGRQVENYSELSRLNPTLTVYDLTTTGPLPIVRLYNIPRDLWILKRIDYRELTEDEAWNLALLEKRLEKQASAQNQPSCKRDEMMERVYKEAERIRNSPPKPPEPEMQIGFVS